VYDSRGVEMVDVVRGNPFFFPVQEIVGLPPGTYFVKYGNQLNGAITCLDCPPTSGTPIVVKPGDTTFGPFNFGTEPTLTITGTVTSAAGGAPLSTIGVDLMSSAGNVVGSTTTDLLGHYAFNGLAPGTYFARTRNDRGFVDEAFNDQLCASCDPRNGTPIVVISSNVAAIDFALAAGGIVQGTVTGTDGGVLGNVPVSLFAGTSALAARLKSSAWGLFRATLPAGTYRARAEATTTHGAEVFSEMPCTSAACDPAVGTPIAVTLTTPVDNVNFTLASCAAMTLSPSILATAVDGRSYRQVFSAMGGVGPYVFDVTDGQLPLGLALDHATGVLAGTPAAPGRSTFKVSALAGNGCATDRMYTLDVQDCAFTLSPTSATVAAAGGNVTIAIGDPCGAQEVTGLPTWLQVQSSSASQVVLSAMANAVAAPRSASVGIGRRVFDVRQAGLGSQPPFGFLDLPTDGQNVSGAFAVTGWALDDLEVVRVLIYRDALGSEPPGMIFLGTATFVPGARPDVRQAAPTFPFNDRAGWGFMILSNMLPNQGNGPFRVHAVAEDAEGQSTLLGSRRIVSNNATAQMPFGTIDRPAQGETISGTNFLNWGWALTPLPGMIPTDGSTIRVVIDGVPLGTVTYNLFRPDVSGTFPGLANTSGPVGYRPIDTTGLAEGLHTISWLVTDDRPLTSGIGSRFFAVANSADAPSGRQSGVWSEVESIDEPAVKPLAAAAAPETGRRAASMDASAVSEEDVTLRRGDGDPRRLRARRDGAREMTIAPMERVELALGASDASCPATWAGYLITRGVLSDLPVGASLDPSGTFYWQTGPGFSGRFPLLFVRTDCHGDKQRLPVVATVQLGK
jgi:hypothetical protein